MSIITEDFENIFGTGPDARQIGANLQSITIDSLTVNGATTIAGIRLSSSIVGAGIPASVIEVVSPLGANMPLVLAPKGNGGISMDIPDGAVAGGNARGFRSVDFQITRAAATQVASGVSCFLAGSINSTVAGTVSVALSSDTANVSGLGCSAISALTCGISTSLQSSVISSDNSTITGSAGSTISTSTLAGITSSLSSTMLSSNNSTINTSTGAVFAGTLACTGNGQYSAVLASTGSTLASGVGAGYNLIASGQGTNVSGNYVCAVGTNIIATVDNCFIFSDNSAGTVSPPNANSFSVRATGAVAAVFYTNAAATTGAQLAAGASAWAAVSDRNLKENITEFLPEEAARIIAALPIYSYNFIGNPTEQKCIGPMAQDWAEMFRTNKSTKHIDSGDLLGMTVAAVKYLLGSGVPHCSPQSAPHDSTTPPPDS
jgi:hypothetical protein